MNGVLVTLVYTVACAGAGLLTMRALSGRSWQEVIQPSIPVGSTALILGQALISSAWMLLGLAGWLLPWVIWTVITSLIIASSALLLPAALHVLVRSRDTFRWLSGESPAMKVLAAGVALLVAGFAMAAWLKPPVGDAEAFYMTYARFIAATGQIKPMPGMYDAFSSIGMIGEPQFAALIALVGVPAAKLFVWPLALAAAAMLNSIGRAAGLGNRGSILLLAMLFTTTSFTHYIWDGKVDLFAAALGLLAVRWVLAARGPSMARTGLAISGLAAGFAVVAKFSYAIALAPALLVLLAWPRDRNSSVVQLLLLVGVFALWSALATVPHLAKNTLLFAAPLAPFLGSTTNQDWLNQVWFAPEVIRRIIATYPLALTFGRYPMQGGNLTFLLLAFLPLAWWLPRSPRLRDSLQLQLCAAGLAGMLLWLVLRPSIIAPRYLLAVLLLFYPLAARAAEHFLDRETPSRLVSAGIVAVTLSALVIFSYPLIPIAHEALRQLRGGSSNSCALASPYCGPLSELNAVAKTGDRVFFLVHYGYWLRNDLLQCRDQGAETRMQRTLRGPGLSWEMLAARGFNWVVVDRTSHAMDDSLLSGSVRPDYLDVRIFHATENLLIFSILDRRSLPPRYCTQSGPNAWQLSPLR